MLDLSYGENPHQRAAYYAERGSRSHLLSRVEQLHGKALSFNNLNDLSAARLLAREFALPACVIVKHANPCGVAIGATIAEAYEKALASDPTSAYGGVVVLNRDVDGPLGEQIAEQFVEVLFAPGYDDDALAALTRKQGTRILVDRERRRVESRPARTTSACSAACSSRTPTPRSRTARGWQVACGRRTSGSGAISCSPGACASTSRSNAIVLARDLADDRHRRRTDEPRRRSAHRRREGRGVRPRGRGPVLASDAFFPFPDGPRIALDAGSTAIVQPGGSKRDQDVIDAVQKAGATMVFTGRRHFRH